MVSTERQATAKCLLNTLAQVVQDLNTEYLLKDSCAEIGWILSLASVSLLPQLS